MSDRDAEAFLRHYLDGTSLGQSEHMLPSALEPELSLNSRLVHDYEIERWDGLRATVLTGLLHGIWVFRTTFEITRQGGRYYIVPRRRGDWLDPWQESVFLSENFELVVVMLPDEDASLGPTRPMFRARVLTGDELGSDVYPSVLEKDVFVEDLDALDLDGDAAAAAEREAIRAWVSKHPEPVVGYLIQPRGLPHAVHPDAELP